MENGVRELPGGGGGFASSGPGRGRGKGSQTRKWAPESAAEPTGHPFKHAPRVSPIWGCLDARHRLPRHARAHHRTVFYVAGESAAPACGEMHSGMASYGDQPNIPLFPSCRANLAP
jgi:hypothetical protein